MDYEKLYKEALERAKSFELPEYKNIMTSVFPELAESEDERIRRNIIAALKGKGYYDCDLTNECIAWLEKQGEQKPIIEMKSAEESLGISSKEYNDIVNECLYGESNSSDKVEPKFKIGDTIRLKNSLAEFTIDSISNGRYYVKGSSIDIIACDRDYELSVPKLFNLESNGEDWSEEDEREWKELIEFLEYSGLYDSINFLRHKLKR